MVSSKNNWKKVRLPKDCPALTPNQMMMVLAGVDEPNRSLVRSSWKAVGFYVQNPKTKVSGWRNYNA